MDIGTTLLPNWATLTWHTFSLHIPIGPVMIGGKVRLDRFSAASDLKQTNAVTALTPTAFVGYAF